MEKKKRMLLSSTMTAAAIAALSNLNARATTLPVIPLGTGAEIRSEILNNRVVSKMLNDLKCGEKKTEADKTKGKEGKCGEGKCGEKKTKGKEGKCGEGKCGEKKTKEQPK